MLLVENSLDQQAGDWNEQSRMKHGSSRLSESEGAESELSTFMLEKSNIPKEEKAVA